MYINMYIAVPLWIFAIFGFLYFLIYLFNSLDLFKRKKNSVYTLVVSAKNREDAVEGIVKDFMLKAGLYGSEEQILQIILVDLGSNDETPSIMKKLSEDYSIVRVIQPDGLKGYFSRLVYNKR